MSFSPLLLEGRKILVTGAGKGIGRMCASQCAALGASVIAVARTDSDIESLVEANPHNIEGWIYDVADPALHHRIKTLPVLDGLVNNAGTNRVGAMIDQSIDNIDTVINLNVRSLYLVAQAAISPMLASGRASIVNMSSQMGFVGSPGRTLYCMSKHAVEGLTKAMAVELAERKIRVNSVAPTFVKTPMTTAMFDDPTFTKMVMDSIPLQRLASTNDIANAVVFLLSELSAMVTGTSLKVDGGWTAR